MHIQGSFHVHGAQAINAPHRTKGPAAPTDAGAFQAADQLDISPQAEMLSRMRDVPEVRADRIAQIREAIQAGVYETPEKLDLAVDRLLDEIA